MSENKLIDSLDKDDLEKRENQISSEDIDNDGSEKILNEILVDSDFSKVGNELEEIIDNNEKYEDLQENKEIEIVDGDKEFQISRILEVEGELKEVKEKTEIEISIEEIEKIKLELEIDRKKLNRRNFEFEKEKKEFDERKGDFNSKKEIFDEEKDDFDRQLVRTEKMMKMRKTIFDRKENDFNMKEEEIQDLINKLSDERTNILEKTIEMRNECSKEFSNLIDSLKDRNIELASEVNRLKPFVTNYEILESRMQGKEESIELLNKEVLEINKELNIYKSAKDLDELLTISNLNEKIRKIELENKNLKIEVNNYKESKNLLEEQELEVVTLRDSLDIYRGRLERQTSLIEHLKRSEKSKGSGEDTTEAIFEEIIEKENNRKIINTVIRYSGDEAFVNGFIEFAKSSGFIYTKDLVRAFIASIKSSKLTILKGYSGTGKSSLPELIGKYLMAECITIPVQPNWRTKQDILGFYNYFTNKFIPTELTKAIIKANVNKDKIFMVVLDEMNLARVEYYFSEFNSKIWLETEKKEIELFEGVSNYGEKVSSVIRDNKVKIPENMVFIGTINEDDSVSPISDKIFDRAQVVEFKELPSDASVGDLNSAASPEENKFTQHETFISKRNNANVKIDKSKKLINKVNSLTKEYFDKVIGYRSIGQINEFIKIYVNSGGEEWKALDWQLMSKFAPKIKFIYEKEDIDSLDFLKMEIEEYFKEEFDLADSQLTNLLFIREIEKISKGGQ